MLSYNQDCQSREIFCGSPVVFVLIGFVQIPPDGFCFDGWCNHRLISGLHGGSMNPIFSVCDVWTFLALGACLVPSKTSPKQLLFLSACIRRTYSRTCTRIRTILNCTRVRTNYLFVLAYTFAKNKCSYSRTPLNLFVLAYNYAGPGPADRQDRAGRLVRNGVKIPHNWVCAGLPGRVGPAGRGRFSRPGRARPFIFLAGLGPAGPGPFQFSPF